MGIDKVGSILAPALLILKLPVALVRVPGKFSNQVEAVVHAWCWPDTKWQVQRPKGSVTSVF
jgi:hypothetical protein